MLLLSVFYFLFCVFGSKSPPKNLSRIDRVTSETLLQAFEIEKIVRFSKESHELLHHESLAFRELEDIISNFPDLFDSPSISHGERIKVLEFFILAVKRAESAAYPFDIRYSGIKAGFHAVAASLFIRLHLYYPQEFPGISTDFVVEYIDIICNFPRESLSDFEIKLFKDLLLATIYGNDQRLFGPLLKYLRCFLDAFDQRILIDAYFVQVNLRSDLNFWEFVEDLSVLTEQMTD